TAQVLPDRPPKRWNSDLAPESGVGDLVQSDRDQKQRDEQDPDDDDWRQSPPPPTINHRAREVDPIKSHAERRSLEDAQAQHIEPDRSEDRSGYRSDKRGHEIGQQIWHQLLDDDARRAGAREPRDLHIGPLSQG